MVTLSRGTIIFGAALAFAARTVLFADPISLLATLIFLSAHYVDRFFGVDRVESKAIARVEALESDLKTIKNDMSHMKLAAGIRGR